MIEGNVFTANQINQLKYVPRLTKDGFGKRRLTDKIFSVITEYYKDNKEKFVDEDGGLDKNGIINAWDETEPGSYIAPHKDFTIWCLENLKVFHEDWCGFELFPCMGYGPRKYVEGAFLQAHADRPYTHIISSIINIDQDVESEWPLQIYGYDNKLHNVFLEPGDILYYEGAKLLHGRTQPLNGKYFINLFLHYRPIEWFLPQENVRGFLKQKKLHEDKTTESDWIEFYEKNTSERICGKKFPEVWLNDRWSNEYNNE